MFKKLMKVLIPPIQTKDNCVSIVEQIESEMLWEELNKRKDELERINLKTTLGRLKKYIQRKMILEGLNPTLAQLQSDAVKYYFELKNSNLIDEFNNIKPEFLEVISPQF